VPYFNPVLDHLDAVKSDMFDIARQERIQLRDDERWQWAPYDPPAEDFDAAISYRGLDTVDAAWIARFAHELGHHYSWREDPTRHQPDVRERLDEHRQRFDREPDDGLDAFFDGEPPLRPVTVAEFEAVLEEERRAWTIARRVLIAVGVCDFTTFEDVECRDFGTYPELAEKLRSSGFLHDR
jgi:hypothetical protein